MKTLPRLFTLSAIIIIVLVISSSATLITSHIDSDEVLVEMLTDTLFVAEGRIGDLLGSATFELALGLHSSNPAVTAQYGWPNGVAVPFTLTYDHAAKLVTFTVDDSVLTYSPISGFSDIFIRARAVDDNANMLVDDLVLDSEVVGDSSNAVGPDGLDILWISGCALLDGFTLTGQTTMTWVGSPPTQSRLAFQIKVGKPYTVPVEETTWGNVKNLFK